MLWLQNPDQSVVDNLNNLRREASRYFRNKQKVYAKVKIDKLETNSDMKDTADLYRGIGDFKKGYQPWTDIVKDEKGVLVSDCLSILTRRRNHFSQLFIVHGAESLRS